MRTLVFDTGGDDITHIWQCSCGVDRSIRGTGTLQNLFYTPRLDISDNLKGPGHIKNREAMASAVATRLIDNCELSGHYYS